jgi:hypothetical protein
MGSEVWSLFIYIFRNLAGGFEDLSVLITKNEYELFTNTGTKFGPLF